MRRDGLDGGDRHERRDRGEQRVRGDWRDRRERGDRRIAQLLWHGTWLASAVIAVGLAMMTVGVARSPAGAAPVGAVAGGAVAGGAAAVPGTGIRWIEAGIALFILLPVARVCLMLGMFVREGDRRFAAIAALVLAIIAAGVIAGL